MRFALGIEYDGLDFFGWQTQAQEPTVQACVESALSRVADQAVSVVCSGRTDTGVHAACQVVHFDCPVDRGERAWVMGGNTHLPKSVCMLWARRVEPEFHARFSASARSYRYVIHNRWTRPALDARQTAWIYHPLDAVRMHEAAQALVGEQDFSTFRAAGCQARHAVRRVRAVSVRRVAERVEIEIEANGFLQHMVRNIAGSLISVGQGDKPVAWIAKVLNARDRTQAGVTAPPQGLVFLGPRYPERFGLPVGAGPAFPENTATEVHET